MLEVMSFAGKKKTGLSLPRILVTLIFICTSLVLIYNFQVIPALIPLAKANLTTEITNTMQNVIRNCLQKNEYNNFVKLTYGNDGNVTSLETNSQSIAAVSSNITAAAVEELTQRNIINVKIPIGNLSGGAILTGKGPNICIKVKTSPKITCKIENEFYESGINQTLHRIIAKIEVKSYALLPLSPQEIDVVSSFCIAETVIVGKVPDAFTKINRHDDKLDESDIDDIYDFGASLDIF